jgi:hypothetical protein
VAVRRVVVAMSVDSGRVQLATDTLYRILLYFAWCWTTVDRGRTGLLASPGGRGFFGRFFHDGKSEVESEKGGCTE